MARTFDPARHPRDRFGRFTKSRTVKASAKDKTAARAVAEGFQPRAVGQGDRQAYLRKIAGDDRAGTRFAGLVEANKALRAGKDSPTAADLEQAMVTLPDDVLLSRRVPLSAFGATDPESLTGMKVRDAGFAPAQLGTVPAADGQVRMHLAVPAGTRAAVNPATGEVVLDRDTEMVVARVDRNSAGGHDMYLTVLPKAGASPDADTPTDGSDTVRGELMKLRVPELRARMRERGLKPGRMRKSQLVDALVADETGDATPDTDAPPGDRDGAPFGERVTAAVSGDDALNAAPFSLTRAETHARLGNRDGLTASSRDALIAYREHEYARINGQLRDAGLGLEPIGDPDADRWIEEIDKAMAGSRLPEPTLTWRGIRPGSKLFGDRLAGDLTGFQWREDAYVSSSTDRAVADLFAGSKGIRMRLVTPAGVGAVQVSGPQASVDGESEILIERGVGMRVSADRGVDPGGVRNLDVEVLPVQGRSAAGGGA